jgi:hypothetical protein
VNQDAAQRSVDLDDFEELLKKSGDILAFAIE